MESSYIGPKKQDSQRRPSTIGLLSPYSSHPRRSNTISSSATSRSSNLSNPSYITGSLDNLVEEVSKPTHISASVARLPAPPSALSQNDFDWTFGNSSDIQASSSLSGLHVPGQASLDNSRRPSSTIRQHADMSVVGIQQYDSRFDAGLNSIRQSYTWPNFDMGLGQQFFSPMSSPALSASLTQFEAPRVLPMYSRSSSNSPPRGSLTPEQRELKKQRDSVRRSSKAQYRRERSSSNSYVVSQQASPALLPGNLSEFTNSVSPSPLLSQTTPPLTNPNYLDPFAPPLSNAAVPDLFAPVYTMSPDDFATPAYAVPYAEPLPTVQTPNFVSRHHSLSSSSDHQLYQPQPQIQVSAKLEPADHVRVVHSRPKPQCWEHGCNGRQFSTFSNLLRHQREKSGIAAKSSCPNCGAEFTRTTARNGHMAHEKCKQRRNS